MREFLGIKMKAKFEFNLETGKESKKATCPHYAVRYCQEDGVSYVEIGDGYRHELVLDTVHWNRILRIIRDNELDKEGIDAITKGLMRLCLYPNYVDVLVTAIKEGKIREFKEIRQ